MTNQQLKQKAKYQINVDLETRNIVGGEPNCHSPMHARLGRHYDITIHSFRCGCRRGKGANRPPIRFWDDNFGQGYTFKGVETRAQAIIDQHREFNVAVRRCRKCDVPPNLPYWD